MAAAKRKKPKSGAGWSWRLAGIALCAFFALGVITGLSRSGRVFALRVEALLNLLPFHARSSLGPASLAPEDARLAAAVPHRPAAASVALVERRDGFYLLDNEGELHGPVSPAAQGDLPVLSGGGVRNAPSSQLLDYAALVVRAEAGLSEMVSEMRVDDDVATLYLNDPPIAIALEPGDSETAIAHAARVLNLWRGHRRLIQIIDMTTPGQAVVRLTPSAFAHLRESRGPAGAAAAGTHERRRALPEVTASR